MSHVANIDHKRAIIFSTSVRFSSPTQSLKQEAIERIVEQILASNTKSLNIQQVQAKISELTPEIIINQYDIEQALKVIATQEKDSIGDVAVQTTYNLSTTKRNEVKHTQEVAENRLNRVVKLLFETAPLPYVHYRDAFLYALSLIFYQVGDDNASMILTNNKARLPSLKEASSSACKNYTSVAVEDIEKGLTKFFEREDPEFIELKWNLAQNYYVSLALGVGQANNLLSREILQGGVLYLDTNIAIALLEPAHPLHKGVMSLLASCRHLNVSLYIGSISIDELERWIFYQDSQLKNGILEQIPVELGHKVDWLMFQVYLTKKDVLEEPIDYSKLLENFSNPSSDLDRKYGVFTEDDVWLLNAQTFPNVTRLAHHLVATYSQRGREKQFQAAIHDATLIFWIQHLRSLKKNKKIWLLTADLRLPREAPIDENTQTSSVITLDALLQWVAPLMPDSEDDFKIIFAEMMGKRLLPQNRFFRPEDFRIFAEMEMECRNLPEKDVIGCVEYIHTNAPNLDPNNAVDREKLTLSVKRYFADPSREYRKDLEKYAHDLGEAQVKMETKEKEYKQIIEEKETSYVKEISHRESEINTLSVELKKLKEQEEIREAKQRSLKKILRASLGLISWLIILCAFTLTLGKGDNWWQRLGDGMGLIAPLLGVYMLVAGIYLTRFDKDFLRELMGDEKKIP